MTVILQATRSLIALSVTKNDAVNEIIPVLLATQRVNIGMQRMQEFFSFLMVG